MDVLQVADRKVCLDAHAPPLISLADGYLADPRTGQHGLEAAAQRLAQRGHGEPGGAVLDGELDDLRRARRRDLAIGEDDEDDRERDRDGCPDEGVTRKVEGTASGETTVPTIVEP